MPSPFPGMDPFIESQLRWTDFHSDMLVDIKRSLLSALPPGFVAETEAYVSIVYPEKRKSGEPRTSPREADIGVFATAPNVPTTNSSVATLARSQSVPATQPETVLRNRQQQRYLKVIDGRGEQEKVIAVIEVLSPTNKDGGLGMLAYERKQAQLLDSDVHFVEVDLLRSGSHAVFVPEDEIVAFGAWDYLFTLHNANIPDALQFWRVGLRDALPIVLLPLTPDVEPVPIPFQEIFTRCYDASRFGQRLDYTRNPEPLLSSIDNEWVNQLLRSAGLRS